MAQTGPRDPERACESPTEIRYRVTPRILTVKIGRLTTTGSIVHECIIPGKLPMVRRALSLTEEQRQELLRLRDHDPRPYVRERGAAILKIAEGSSPHRVARSGLLKPRDPDTVYAWMGRYQAEGGAGFIAHPRGRCRGRHCHGG